jgi:hypothetical protein
MCSTEGCRTVITHIASTSVYVSDQDRALDFVLTNERGIQ